VERLTTPLVRQMDQFARQVTFVILAVSALVFAYAVLAQSYPFNEAFMDVVGLSVAAIPEGLPPIGAKITLDSARSGMIPRADAKHGIAP
jgi:magnesium-transporting ATPase (P-type)